MNQVILSESAERLARTYFVDAGRAARAKSLVEIGAVCPSRSSLHPELFRVASQESAIKFYRVNSDTFTCQCEDWQKHRDPIHGFICKHIFAALIWMKYHNELKRQAETQMTGVQKFDAFVESLGVKKLELAK